MPTICYIPTQLYPRATVNDTGTGVQAAQGRPIGPSYGAYASACHTVRKKGGTVRLVQDLRELHAFLKEQIERLGNLPAIFDEMGRPNCFTCLDLASGFLQLTIRESDRHLAAFRDAEGKLWEYVRCRSGFKTVPSAFETYVDGQLVPVKMKDGWTTSSSPQSHWRTNSLSYAFIFTSSVRAVSPSTSKNRSFASPFWNGSG